jgi:hypothetical protein
MAKVPPLRHFLCFSRPMADRRIKLKEGVVVDFGSMAQPSGKA